MYIGGILGTVILIALIVRVVRRCNTFPVFVTYTVPTDLLLGASMNIIDGRINLKERAMTSTKRIATSTFHWD